MAGGGGGGGGGAGEEERLCWVCFGTDADTVSPEGWVSPCLCSGSTKWCHHACLRRWILESGGPDKTVCPQCRTVYRVVHPERNALVRVGDALSVAVEAAMPVSAFALFSLGTVSSAFLYGLVTFQHVCGRQVAHAWLSRASRPKVLLTMPLIPLTLVLCRLRINVRFSLNPYRRGRHPDPHHRHPGDGDGDDGLESGSEEDWETETETDSEEDGDDDDDRRGRPRWRRGREAWRVHPDHPDHPDAGHLDAESFAGGFHVALQRFGDWLAENDYTDSETETDSSFDTDDSLLSDDDGDRGGFGGGFGGGFDEDDEDDGIEFEEQRLDLVLPDVSSPTSAMRLIVGGLLFPYVASAVGWLCFSRVDTTRFGRTVLGGCTYLTLKHAVRLCYQHHKTASMTQLRIMDYTPS